MHSFSAKRISDFMLDIQSVSIEWYEMAVQIRDIHFQCNANISEDIKYGGLVFFLDAEMISGIFFYKQHISIEFGNGACMPDPESVLEGKGKFRRHIKLRSQEDIIKKNLVRYVRQAFCAGTT